MKRGAIELSISTIIIVVIGVTLLTLGLVFIKGIFGGLDKLTLDVFDTAETEIGNIHGKSKFSMQTNIDVNQGKKETFKIYVGNDGSTGSSINIKINNFICQNMGDEVGARLISPASQSIDVGQEAIFTAQVAATKNALISQGSINEPQCSVTVSCSDGCTGTYATGGFIINILPKKSLF